MKAVYVYLSNGHRRILDISTRGAGKQIRENAAAGGSLLTKSGASVMAAHIVEYGETEDDS